MCDCAQHSLCLSVLLADTSLQMYEDTPHVYYFIALNLLPNLLFSRIQIAMEHVGEESAPWLDVCGLPVSVVCVYGGLVVRCCLTKRMWTAGVFGV